MKCFALEIGSERNLDLFDHECSIKSGAGGRLREAESPAPNKNGGARRDRTDDLMLAKHALSQLSYGPNPATPALQTNRPNTLAQAEESGGPGKI